MRQKTSSAQQSQVQAAAADDCGFNFWGQYFHNCVDHDQLLIVVVNDYVTYESWAEYICVPSQESKVIMPGFTVLSVDVASDSC